MATIAIKWEDLPNTDEDQDYYYVRMRVVSTDENRTSYWVYSKVEKKVWSDLREKASQKKDPVV